MKPNIDYCVQVCNELLKSELSAMRTYAQAVEKYADSPVAEVLRGIRKDHSRAAIRLAVNVRDLGGEPEEAGNAWEHVLTSLNETESLFGEESAIDWLQKGEEMVRRHYQNALLDDHVVSDSKMMIREELLPAVIYHIASLERLEEAV